MNPAGIIILLIAATIAIMAIAVYGTSRHNS